MSEPSNDFPIRISLELQEQEINRATIQLLKLLDSLRITDDQPRVRLYRAITGPSIMKNSQQIFQGTDPQRLQQYGIFEINLSHAQFNTSFSTASYDRRVPGLPVFATPQEALNWIIGKRFDRKPTIAVLDLPLSILTRESRMVVLVRNTLDPLGRGDFEVPPILLETLSRGEGGVRGECYLRGSNPQNATVPEFVRKYEILVQPNKLYPDGKVDFNSGFSVLKFD